MADQQRHRAPQGIGSLVGHLRSVLPDAQNKTAAGTLYACPVVSVLEKCGDLLPIPDPIFGLPGLPQQPLPDVPYRYLDRFTGEYAEVFFGRDAEIRRLYNMLTAANPPPLTLLYGQSGVGKSSFLAAGVVPRLQMHYETKYLRRDPQRSLLETLQQQTEPGKPSIVIFDQIEECAANELSEFLAAIKGLPHRIVLSFRKERLAEIQKQVSQAGIDSAPMLLKPLDHAAIIEIVNGLKRSQRLDNRYHLTIEPDLPEMIAQLMVADHESPVAPILEWLLSKLWERAKAANKDEPAMTVELYRQLRHDGLAQAEFWDQQVKKLATTQAAAVDSGLALDVLTYYTTQLATAQRRSQADLLAAYGHCAAQMPALVREMEAHFLLCDASTDGEKASRLIHDTLAPLVLGRSDRSIKLGQRARRIIESHIGTWDHTEDNALDGGSLAVVEGGLAGMRDLKLEPPEQDLLAASRSKHVKEARASLRRRNVKTLVFVAITTLAIVSIWGWISASQQERIAELRFQAATVQVSLPASPLNALLLAMAATHDNLAPPTLVRLPWTRNNVLPAVQYALSSAMVKATEDARIEQDPIGAVAMTPDGSLIVTSTSTAPASSAAGAKPVATLKFWNRFGSPSDSLPPPLPSFEWRLMAFSPNGNLLAFGGQGLSVLDLQKKVLSGPDSFGGAQGLRNLTSIAFTEDGKYLLAGEGDGILRVFAVDGREVTKVQADYGRHLVRLPIFSRGAMNDASMMPDEVPSPEHPERYDLPPNLQTLATTSGLKGETLVATGGYEGVGRLWKLDEAKSGDAKLTLVKEFHVGVHITSVAITVRGGQVLVAVGDMSGKLQIWDQTGQSNVPYSFSDSISAIAFHPKSSLVAATGMDGTIRYLSFSGVSIAPPFHGVLRTINTLLFFPDGNRLLAGAKGGVRFLDMDMLGGSRRITAFDDFQNSSLQTQSSQTPVGQTQSSDKIVGAAFLKGGLAVAGTEAGDLYFYFRETDAVRHVPGNPGLGFHVLAANRQGTLIAAAGNHGRIHLFDPSGSKIGEMRPPADVSQAAEHLVFSDDGKTLATDYPDGRILVWDVDRRQQKTLIPRQATQDHLLHLMAFTPAGDLAAIPVSPLDNKSIPVLRLLHFQQDGSLPGIRKMTLVDPATSELQVDVTALAFRHDGKGFLTGHADGMVQHWAMDGKPVGRPIQLGKTSILWMAGDAESGRLYLADTNGIGTATDPVPSGSSAVEATASFDLPLEIKSAALSVEEDEIVTVDQSGVRIWPADWRTFLRESCERLQNHAVFTRHAKIEGVSLDVIDRALAVCQEQVKKP